MLIAVLLFGIFVAYDENSSIFMVVSYAWAGLGASFGPLTLDASLERGAFRYLTEAEEAALQALRRGTPKQ